MTSLNDNQLVAVCPSKRQLTLQRMEFYGFIHFTLNTFTGREWGDGTEAESLFNPSSLDTQQWAAAAVDAGMKGLILTCKHHDGFCLWPSKFTDHSIAKSPYKDGMGDLVKETADACKKFGLKFGVYLSPWDRNQKTYGYGSAYDDYFTNQLTELLTQYGDIFTVWLDGACGEGANGVVQQYDWDRYYSLIRKLQPEACISVCGPDVRWCGNEAGEARPSEWSVVPARLGDKRVIAANSQQEDSADFRQKKLTAMDLDIGSRAALEGEDDLIWYPAEVDVSIRPGWFYHREEDEQLHSLDELKEIYLNSVGGNAMLLLNIPPTKEGLIHKNDVDRLKELGDSIRNAFSTNLLDQAQIIADCEEKTYLIENTRNKSESYFKTPDFVQSVNIDIKWKVNQKVTYIELQEQIRLSQRIEKFTVYSISNNGKEVLYTGTVVGYKKIIKLKHPITTFHIRICIEDSRIAPTLQYIGVY